MTNNTTFSELALRFDVSKEDSLNLSDKINKYLSSSSHLWVFELGKKTEKPHIHGYVKTEKKISTIRKWIINQKFYNGSSSYFLKSLDDNKAKYLDYMCKDMDIVTTDMSEEQIDSLLEEAQRIKDDKGRTMVDKLFNFVVGDYIADYDEDLYTQLSDIEVLEKCILFYKKHKLLMPNKSQMFQYCQTILNITNNDSSVFADYYSIFSTKVDNNKTLRYMKKPTVGKIKVTL